MSGPHHEHRTPGVTEILARIDDEDVDAQQELWTLVYDELRTVATRLVRGESKSSTLQPTALVNDVYLRLFGGAESVSWDNRAHFFGAATRGMRQLLIDRARRRSRRGEDARVSLEPEHGEGRTARECDAVDLVDALDRLEESDPPSVTNQAGGSTSVDGGAEITGNFLQTDGTLTVGTVGTGGTITGTTQIDAGTATVGATGTLVGDATVNGTGSLSTAGTVGNIINDGTTDGSDNVTVTGGSVASLDNNSGDATISGGTVSGATSVDGGSVTNNGGTMTGAVTVATGAVYDQNGGAANGGVVNNGSADVTLDGGTVASLDHNGGTTTVTGARVTGNTDIDGGAVVVNGIDDATVELGGTTTVNSGTLTITDGDVNAVVNNATADGTADVTLTDGQVASLTNSGDAQLDGGQITGTTTISAGTVTNSGATLSGATTVAAGSTYAQSAGSAAGGVTNNGGDVDVTGGSLGSLANNSGIADLDGGSVTGATTNAGTLNLNGGGLGGNLNNSGTANVLAATTIGGSTTNTGNWDIDANLIHGGFTSTSGTIDVDAAVTSISGGSFNSAGALTLGTNTAFTGGALRNSGTLTAETGGFTADAFLNTGTVDLMDGATDDAIVVNGATSLEGTIELDIDLDAGTSDTITIIGGATTTTGTVNLSFASIGGSTTDPITVLDYDEGFAFSDAQFSASGLPTGSLIYGLTDSGTSLDVIGVPAAGALASGVVLTQGLISSVVNRPSSPFVAGLAAADDDPCGAGMWGRTIGGVADASGTISPETLTNDIPGSIEAEYYGIQLGGDFSCFDGYYNGWDLSFGGIVGVNQGSTTQPVSNFVVSGGNVTLTNVISRNESEFTQSYAGLYLGASRDRLFADIQYRYESTDFQVQNVDEPGDAVDNSLGLDDSFSTTAQTLSGSVGYVFPLNEELGINFVPSGGFSITQTSEATLTFDDGSLLVIDESTSEIAFVAGTISRTQIRPDGISALNYFGTATIYSDFASPTRSEYFQIDGGSLPATGDVSESSNLGTYGELSVGVNYTRLLEPGDIGPARQLNASVRVDGRFSDDIESYGLTAQARLQF